MLTQAIVNLLVFSAQAEVFLAKTEIVRGTLGFLRASGGVSDISAKRF